MRYNTFLVPKIKVLKRASKTKLKIAEIILKIGRLLKGYYLYPNDVIGAKTCHGPENPLTGQSGP